MRTKEELLERFERVVENFVDGWTFTSFIEYVDDFTQEELEEIKKLGLHDLYENHRKRMTEE